MIRRLVGALEAIASITLVMAGILLLKYGFLVEHLNLK